MRWSPLTRDPLRSCRLMEGIFTLCGRCWRGMGAGHLLRCTRPGSLSLMLLCRTDADREHARKLPEGYYVVEEIRGHRDGEVLVKWLGVEEPKWQLVDKSLQQVLQFRAYCAVDVIWIA